MPIMSQNSFQLKDKIVLVTGASRGIGKAIALGFAKEGAKVAFTYTGTGEKSQSNAMQVCEEINKLGAESLPLALDISNTTSIPGVIDSVLEKWGGLDVLVNNAGIVIDQLAMRYREDDFDKVMNVNVKGTFFLCKAALRALSKSEVKSIVNISSVVALSGAAGQVVYSASKGAIISLTKSLAREMSARAVRINCVAPGYIATDMTSFMNDEQKNELIEKIPLKREGSVEDVANGVLYLASPLSSYVTGQILNINGGLYM
jgi:3-oxoacyl-[acyl-carrier protein] reductase